MKCLDEPPSGNVIKLRSSLIIEAQIATQDGLLSPPLEGTLHPQDITGVGSQAAC
jgi:hypothetical protein